MTRKILAIVIAMAMCLCFTACGSAEKDENVLRVAMECAYAPYNWSQADDSNGAVPIAGTSDYAYGYDVMMAKLIAESMGKELVAGTVTHDNAADKTEAMNTSMNTSAVQ